MGGFEVPRTIYKLEWDDPAYDGLVVRVRAGTVREALDRLTEMWDLDGELSIDERRKRVERQHADFVSHVVDWNLCCDGEPLPVTVEALQSMEGTLVGSMIRAWAFRPVKVSPPLDSESTGGEQSAVLESIPMESLSESLAS